MESLKLFFALLFVVSRVHCNENSLIFVQDENSSDDGPNEEVSMTGELFKATNEWQEIGDQVLPKGLHVRINLETGKKEAKLLESAAELDVHSRITSNYQVVETDHGIGPTKSSSKKKLMDLNDWKAHIKESSAKQYKSMEELKQSGVHFTSESELLSKAFERYRHEHDPHKRASLLTDLEYFVHSIDLANDLHQAGGFEVLQRDLNQTSAELKLAVLNVFGAAIQSNSRLKDQLYKHDFLRHIVILLAQAKEVSLLKKSIFLLSAFLRNYARAQRAFFQSYNGIEIFESLLTKDSISSTRASILLGDIALEIASTSSSSNVEELQMYETFETSIQNSNICLKLVQLLHRIQTERAIVSNLLESMTSLAPVCSENFRQHSQILQQISAQLKQDNDEFAMTNMNNLLSNLNIKDEL